jgi:branched-chain amino acid transport system permease protein
VIGGLGSLGGALVASILIGCVQTFAVATSASLGSIAAMFGASVPPAWASLTIAQIAPVLPYLLLVAMLSVRPRGLFGEGGDDA